jgi:hypothetical protein
MNDYLLSQMSASTRTLVLVTQHPAVKRIDMADWYRKALANSNHATDWATVNAAIIDRWSESGLKYIKRKAWK